MWLGVRKHFQMIVSADGRSQLSCEVDEAGNPIGPTRVTVVEPATVPNGLTAVPDHVSRFVASTEPKMSLVIFALDRHRGCVIGRFNGRIEVALPYSHLREHPWRERAARELFARNGIAPVPDAYGARAEVLRYPLPGTAERITAICLELLVSCYEIAEDEPLQFNLMKHQ